ncbi:hypothetical protein JCM17960_12980 [Magnetospira thiophila]
MFVLPFSRVHLLDFLPKGGTVAEIGVAEGDFSQEILTRAQPERLHLIDPWTFQDDIDYQPDPSNLDSATQDQRAQKVAERFADRIQRGDVVLHRTYSHLAAPDFSEGTLDWVYLDGNHTEAAVFQDLTLYSRRIHPDGLILGHDYSNGPAAQTRNFGVIEAVDRFVAETDFDFIALTLDAFPTYVLGRPDSPRSREVVQRLLYNVTNMVEIRDPLSRLQQRAVKVADRWALVQSF